ncbi:unnamed protein product, partial [Choristocarpus tenellus]
MTRPSWPRRRYQLWVKKGTAPLGVRLHQTKNKKGVYINCFTLATSTTDALSTPHQETMRVGDLLVSVDGKDMENSSLPTALLALETARRRVRL